MKKFLLLVVLLASTAAVFSQLSVKKMDSGKLSISDSVTLKKGDGELTTIFASLSVDPGVWENYRKNQSDSTAFREVVFMITLKAQYSLKNTLSFVPMKEQFIMWYEKQKSFMSDYKMYGRNGYGNLVESKALVFYKP
jgi:hypothetical protein